MLRHLRQGLIFTSLLVDCRLVVGGTVRSLTIPRHPKLMDIGESYDFGRTLNNEYILHFVDNFKNATAAMETIVRGTSAKIEAVLGDDDDDNDDFKFGLISGVSHEELISILDNDMVTIATRDLTAITEQSFPVTVHEQVHSITDSERRVADMVTVQTNVTWNLDRLSKPYPNGKYKYKYDGTGVTVFVFGHGVRATHQEFGGRASCGYSVYNDDCFDEDSKGTFLGGIVGGIRYGVAKNVTMKFVKTNHANSNDLIRSIFRAIRGIRYVVKQKRKQPTTPMIVLFNVVAPSSGFFDRILNKLSDSGLIFLSGSGNILKDSCKFSPTSAKDCIVVGIINETNYRPSAYTNYGPCIDLFAPGYNVTSAKSTNDTGTAKWSASSIAAAHTAGVVAMYLQKNPTWKTQDVKAALIRDAIPNAVIFTPLNITVPDLSPNYLLCSDNITNS